MSFAMAPANGSDDRQPRERHSDRTDERRARARRNALWLALIAAAFYVGFIVLSGLNGFSPG